MKRRVLGFLLVMALLLGVSAIAAGCGDGEGALSLEEYFQQIQATSDNLQEREEALDREFEAASGSETGGEVDVDALKRIFGEAASAFRDALNDVEGLEPPSEAEDAHREFVEQARVRAELIESLADELAKTESLSDMEAVFAAFDDPDFEAAAGRFKAACEALEGVAADNGIEVDMACE